VGHWTKVQYRQPKSTGKHTVPYTIANVLLTLAGPVIVLIAQTTAPVAHMTLAGGPADPRSYGLNSQICAASSKKPVCSSQICLAVLVDAG